MADPQTDIFISSRDSNRCMTCGNLIRKGQFLVPAGKECRCLKCAGLDQLSFLPAGDAALTRRTKKYAATARPVLKWSRSRKRFQRQGLLAEQEAILRARAECEADAPEREKRQQQDAVRRAEADKEYINCFADEVRRLYPYCPEGRELNIAEHACRKYSGRVGRSAQAKSLDEKAVRLAVTAHIRHTETDYDHLCETTRNRSLARSKVLDKVNLMLRLWSA